MTFPNDKVAQFIMSRFRSSSVVTMASIIACASLLSINSRFDDRPPNDKASEELADQVAALEKTVSQLRRQFADEKLASTLRGHWLEASRVVAGQREKQTEEVAWRLATDASSDRYILGPEVSSYHFGRFTVDTSQDPVAIDFELHRSGQTHTVKGLVRSSYGKCEIALPGKLFDGYAYLDPPRPTQFESTADNQYDVYSLIRKRYKQTGVWQ